jgi:hypothetical protein
MAHKKSHRRRNPKTQRKNNILNKTLKRGYSVAERGYSVAKQTSKKYMPKVKSSIETIGSNVTESAKESVPYLQKLTRRIFDMIGVRTRKNSKSRGFVW